MSHALMANRNGLVVAGTAQPEAALELIDQHRPMAHKGGRRRIMPGASAGRSAVRVVAGVIVGGNRGDYMADPAQ